MGFWSNIFGGEPRSLGKLEIKLCESKSDVPDDVPYRLVEDQENWVRINQEYKINNENNWDVIEEYTMPVAGVSYRGTSVISFIAGDNRRIKLVQEPSPKYPHAIAVIGEWIDSKGGSHKEQLGFVPDEDAREINKHIKKKEKFLLVGKLTLMFIPTAEKDPGLRIDVLLLEPAWPRFEIHGLGRDSGRKRKKTYRAKDFEDAIMKASKDGIIVDVSASKKVD